MTFALLASLFPAVALFVAEPPLTFELFTLDKKAELSRVMGGRSERPRLLLPVLPDGAPEWAERHAQLADLYAEKARYFDVVARALDIKLAEASPKDRPPLEQARADDIVKREHWRQEATKVFALASRYPGYERAAEVLLHFGKLMAWSGDHQQARTLFDRLLEEYPRSPAASDGAIWLGEVAFRQGDLPAALALYEKIAAWERGHWRSFAVYKKGWCQLKLGQPGAALATFAATVRMAEQDPALNTGQRSTLAKAAKKDLVKAFAQVRPPGEAQRFFREVGGEYAPKMLGLLAEIYRQQGKVDVAEAVMPQPEAKRPPPE